MLQQVEHPSLKRDGSNLFHKRSITLLEALTGFQFYLPHLDGRVLLVKSEPGCVVKPGDVKCLREEGMPLKNNPYHKGNLYVEFEVEFPQGKSITEATKKVLKSVLPPPINDASAGPSAMSDSDVSAAPEEVQLQTVDFEEEKKKFAEQSYRERHERHGAENESDDEDDMRGRRGPQAQCRQQ